MSVVRMQTLEVFSVNCLHELVIERLDFLVVGRYSSIAFFLYLSEYGVKDTESVGILEIVHI